MSVSDVEALAGGVLVTGFPGRSLDAGVLQRLRTLRPAGVLLFERNAENVAQLRALTSELRAALERPIVAIDQEGGRVMRLRIDGEVAPSAREIGTRGVQAAREAGDRIGALLARCGVNVNFAPVLDLDLLEENTVIGDRSYGRDPARVIALGSAFAAELRRHGVVPVFKHFPGHGSSAIDSHHDLPVVRETQSTLRARDLVPFAALLPSAEAVMSAHVRFDAFDAHAPATLSSRILIDLLRGEMGFRGVCFTDCLEMGALNRGDKRPELAVEAIAAGADCILVSHDLDYAQACVTAVARAARDGRLSPDRLREAHDRVRALREGLYRAPAVRRRARFPVCEQVLRSGLGGEYTAAVARIESRGTVVFERAVGTTRLDRGRRAVYADTRFDLASLTKVVTSSLILRAGERGRIALDEPAARWLPEWRETPKAKITTRMLLAHTSGMHSGADYRELLGHDVTRFALSRELAAQPGERVIYSDLGFIALGTLLERAEGRSLAALVREIRPSMMFRPPVWERGAIPATEEEAWRGRVQGFVHDEKAYLMGGVAGHAGLFATARDVAWIAEQYLAPLHGRCSAFGAFTREAIREQAYDPVVRRGLGWALKTSDENSCGRFFSAQTFGHTGFVGTSVWADPVRDCSGVLLTNAVYFGRREIRDLRAAFYEAMIEELDAR